MSLQASPPISEGVLYLAAPTASGKSALAVALAQRIGAEIVNADAFQLYLGLPIITAQPDTAALQAVPHHLYSVLESGAEADAQRYRELVEPVLADLKKRRKWAVIVGGSGLYLKALTHGLAPVPKGDPALRAELAALTSAQRVAELLRLDPAAADNVPLSNDRYVSRALEICRLTGRPQSELRQHWKAAEPPRFRGVLLEWEREALHQRINERTVSMMEAGAVEEVRKAAMEEGRDGTMLSVAIGVREIMALLKGEATMDATVAAIQQATRRYAKRQQSWFRRETGFQKLSMPAALDVLVDRVIQRFPELTSPPLA